MIDGNDFLVWRWKWVNYKDTISLSHLLSVFCCGGDSPHSVAFRAGKRFLKTLYLLMNHALLTRSGFKIY